MLKESTFHIVLPLTPAFKTEAEALQYIAGRLNRNSISVEEIKEWNEEHELDDDYISLHDYEIVA